jgi:hypothetical protein
MPAVVGLALTAAGLLVTAGATKLVAPQATVRVLRDAGLAVAGPWVRAAGGVEVAVGSAALLVGGGRAFAALALTYAVLAAVAWRQQRRGADCGCFGADTGPTTRLHVAVDVVAVVVAATAALLQAPGLLATTPTIALGPTAVALALTVALVRLALVQLPDLWDAQALHRPERT